MSAVKQQYERFPYPPISALALPKRNQGRRLCYERAVEMTVAKGLPEITPKTHDGLRILVVGAGTLEALVVAQAHPRAAEVVALDISAASLSRLRRRLLWARLSDAIYLAKLRGHRLPPVRLVEADVRDWNDDKPFDYIIASNVLHHTDEPAQTLKHLSSLLRPGGVMRVVTYADMSRYWIRQTSRWLRWHGLNQETPRLKKRSKEVIALLPDAHPIRSCYRGHIETASDTGIVDAFFHVCENPLSPLAWQAATEVAGLALLGESQAKWAQSSFLEELLPDSKNLSVWQCLQVLDDCLELTSNPVWWFCKTAGDLPELSGEKVGDQCELSDAALSCGIEIDDLIRYQANEWSLPSETYWQLGQSLRSADKLLQHVGLGAEELLTVLQEKVGPRVTQDDCELQGLTLGEYQTDALLDSQRPLADMQWRQLEDQCGSCKLWFNDAQVAGETLAQQAEWLQLYHGPLMPMIGPLSLKLA